VLTALEAQAGIDPCTGIEAEKAGKRNVTRAGVMLKVSRSAFYAHQAGPSPLDRKDTELIEQIRAVHQ
jgi:hypothetical protein